MNLQQQRALARQQCADQKITVLPYGNAWWLLGDGVNQVVGELAGISPAQLQRFTSVRR
ncbi:hypothetical protein VX159_09325 [Dechloromonas sp. ZY10]|uniref:hypothetical protein n=1 Tax=Dechloromonas aquae TaxID=2664436 RepID=UPI003528740D